MTFKWNITLPPFHGVLEGVEVSRAGIALEFETGSIAEAHGIFQDNGTAISETFGDLLMGRAVETATRIEAPGNGQASNAEIASESDNAAPVKRKYKPRGTTADPASAAAPAPVTIPGADAPPLAPPVPGADPLDIPEALRRTAAAPVAPPPAPPAAPPTGILAGKIIAELDKRATGSADGGQALADWLATSAITIKGATYAEAVVVLRLQADEKLGPIAQALGVA